jgi:hypothetical protein
MVPRAGQLAGRLDGFGLGGYLDRRAIPRLGIPVFDPEELNVLVFSVD